METAVWQENLVFWGGQCCVYFWWTEAGSVAVSSNALNLELYHLCLNLSKTKETCRVGCWQDLPRSRKSPSRVYCSLLVNWMTYENTDDVKYVSGQQCFCTDLFRPAHAADYGMDGPGIECRWGRNFPHPFRPVLGPTQPSVDWIPGLSRG